MRDLDALEATVAKYRELTTKLNGLFIDANIRATAARFAPDCEFRDCVEHMFGEDAAGAAALRRDWDEFVASIPPLMGQQLTLLVRHSVKTVHPPLPILFDVMVGRDSPDVTLVIGAIKEYSTSYPVPAMIVTIVYPGPGVRIA